MSDDRFKEVGLITEFNNRGKTVEIYKTPNGKYTAFVDSVIKQKDMTSDEVIRYMGHSLHTE